MSEMASHHTTTPNDSDLLSRFAKTRDEDAFALLMHRHWGFVFSITRRALTNSALAEDATQQTFITLAKKAKGLRKDLPLGPWLYRTACHEASNLRRKETRHQKRNLDYASLTSSPDLENNLLTAKLHNALANLSASDRKLVILRFYQGLSSEEIADSLNISTTAAQKRTHRALTRLSDLAQEPDPKTFGLALPVFFAPSATPPSGALTKILSTSAKSTSLLLPAAGWLLATTLSVSAVRQIYPHSTQPSPSITQGQSTIQSEGLSKNRVRRTRTVTPALPEDPVLAQFITIARRSPQEAFIWADDQIPLLHEQEPFLKKTALYLAKTDLSLTKKLLAARTEGYHREPWIVAVLRAGLDGDFPATIKWLESLPNHSDQSACYFCAIQDDEKERYIDTLHQALYITTNPSIQSWLLSGITRYYAEIDETKIFDLAQTLEGDLKTQALKHLTSIYLDRDHPKGTDLIHQLKGNVDIDEHKVARRNPAHLLETILPYVQQNPNILIKTHFLIDNWFKLDPDAVRAWSSKNDPTNVLRFSPNQRNR